MVRVGEVKVPFLSVVNCEPMLKISQKSIMICPSHEGLKLIEPISFGGSHPYKCQLFMTSTIFT